MQQHPRQNMLILVLLALLLHGLGLLVSFQKTYDAFVHIFFADHYARHWFELWEDRWYTGFPVTSYPPLVHQLIALLSLLGGIRVGFVVLALLVVACLVIGVYRFSRLWVPEPAAQVAAGVAMITPSVIEALHAFGQLPTLMAIAILLNALPDVYQWIRSGTVFSLVRGLALVAVTVASHHVTPLFGMVFFMAPVVMVALFDQMDGHSLRYKSWFITAWQNRWRLASLFLGVVVLLVIVIFPYWQNNFENPIKQVPIPHGSRDSFIAVHASGLLFFLIPLGTTLLIVPYIFRQYLMLRNLPMGLSLLMLLLLGTGGTTPLPRLLLGNNAFQILTLDRFMFWGTLVCIPFVGGYLYALATSAHRYKLPMLVGFGCLVAGQTVYIVNLDTFRKLQPASIEVTPIVNFLNTDQHKRWRYLTLGFGDQMAWLSSQTTAQSVDGNYHSARQLPELTNYPIERLESAKFKGMAGLASLESFLTNCDKYALKYIFSNDKFYDPILYFSGWERVQRLENGIVVWQKPDVPPLGSAYSKRTFSLYQRLHWGLLPMLVLLAAIGISVWGYLPHNRRKAGETTKFIGGPPPSQVNVAPIRRIDFIWIGVVALLSLGLVTGRTVWQRPFSSPQKTVQTYYQALDLTFFDKAYQCFDPAHRPNYETYLLQLSVSDGLLASYAKFSTLQVQHTKTRGQQAELEVNVSWITPIGRFSEIRTHTLVNRDGEWRMVADKRTRPFLPDRFLQRTATSLYLHGKRRLSIEPSPADDILDRPEIQILSANLVMHQNRFAIVGELINMDHLPAHLNIEGEFIGATGKSLATVAVKNVVNYQLLPQESTFFRIDFPERINRSPTDFKLTARAVSTQEPLYRALDWQHVKVKSPTAITAELINSGTEEVTIPAVLAGYFGTSKQLRWVENQYLPYSILPQRTASLRLIIPLPQHLTAIKTGTADQFLVNGLQPKASDHNQLPADQIVINNETYCRLKVNPFIGNPR